MSRSVNHRPSPALIVALLALFVALGGGALAATSFIGSDGQVHGCVGKKGQLTVLKPGKKCGKGKSAIAWNQRGPRGVQGIRGPGGTNATNGTNGVNGTARAYAEVVPNGTGTPTVSNAKNVTGATRQGAGLYCVAIDPASGVNLGTGATSPAVPVFVTVNFFDSPSADVGLFAYVSGVCGANAVLIDTADQTTAGALPVRNDSVAINVAVP